MVVENKRCGEWWIDTHLLDKYLKEIETVGEWVDEIDKLAELNGEMQLKQEDPGCVHASYTELSIGMPFMLLQLYEHDGDHLW
ncbi:hypothetical protein Tco_0020527 [Tanacetum coccineum]